MFREINISKQSEGGPKRRWYQSDYFDLYIFYVRHSERSDKYADREFVGMQLCYDIRRNQRTLEWKKVEGFAHHVVKKGGGDTLSDHGASAALLQKGGEFDAAKVVDRFMSDSGGLPGIVKTFVLQKLAEYARLHPLAPPTQQELDAAAAAANVAEQIVAQVEAEAEALRAEQAAANMAPVAIRVATADGPSATASAGEIPPSLRAREARVTPHAVWPAPPLPAALAPSAALAATVAAPAATLPVHSPVKRIEDFNLDDLLDKA